MTTFRGFFNALLILLGVCESLVAQTQLATGAQPFDSFTPTSFETFDNGNLKTILTDGLGNDTVMSFQPQTETSW